MLTILCWHPTTHNTFCIVLDLNSSLLVETQTDLIWSDPRDSTARFEGRTSTLIFSKSWNSQDISSGHDVIYPLNLRRASFPVWEFIMTDHDCHMLSARACECTDWQWHLKLETPPINYIYIYIYIYIYTRGSLNKFPSFFRMGTFIDTTHMKL